MKFRAADLHCDTIMGVAMRGRDLYDNEGHISLKRALELPGYAQFFGFFTSFFKEQAPEKFHEAYNQLLAACDKYSDYVSVCRTVAEGEQAMDAGKVAAFISIEGSEALACDPGRLDEAWEMGVRIVGLTWNFENALSGSCKTGNGLTEVGREYVRRAQDLGIWVDVSHLSEQGFFDLCDITRGPIIATHSNSAAVYPHERNLTDDQFRQIMQTGGLAGMNLYADFLGEAGTVTFETVYQHLDHFLQMGGERNVCLGGDLDGCERLPEGFEHVDDYNKLADYLVGRGLSEMTVADFYYNNFAKAVKTWNT
ncbi:MAG: membrane dipeptidase [Oscillospiraceae bacterium]|nr:membrane dipeptidase [Oscillospiraceae bacterium]